MKNLEVSKSLEDTNEIACSLKFSFCFTNFSKYYTKYMLTLIYIFAIYKLLYISFFGIENECKLFFVHPSNITDIENANPHH